MDLNWYVENTIEWAKARNLIDGSDVKSQFVKLAEEFGELASGIAKGNDGVIEDSIGDMLVVLIILSQIHGKKEDGDDNTTWIIEYLSYAYNEIKDRKGKMVDGVFVKEE